MVVVVVVMERKKCEMDIERDRFNRSDNVNKKEVGGET